MDPVVILDDFRPETLPVAIDGSRCGPGTFALAEMLWCALVGRRMVEVGCDVAWALYCLHMAVTTPRRTILSEVLGAN